ncbi:diguanylate cyclase [Corallincola platygyrae]|uniref:Diguanylate cyclase n=1 Tax=Corallincola platygyrae TaxID=1193278 RepID=A0ABW4XP81_9GAMM
MPLRKDPLQPELQRILAPYFWPILVIILVIFSSISTYNYFSHRDSIREQRTDAFADTMEKNLTYVEQGLLGTLQHIEDTTRLLVKSKKLFSYIEQPDQINKYALEQEWSLLAQASGKYTHLGFVDIHGQKQIGIEYDPSKDLSAATDTLGRSNDAEAMSLASKLDSDETALIIFNLEAQKDQISVPYQLSGKTIAAVSHLGSKRGYTVMELEMEALTQVFDNKISALKIPMQVLTAGGHFIRSENPDHLYGHEVAERANYNLANLNPALWREVTSHNQGAIRIGGDLYVYKWIKLGTNVRLMTPASEKILLLSHVPKAVITEATQPQISSMKKSWATRALLILLLSMGLALVTRYILTKLKVQQLMLTAMSEMSAVMLLNDKGRIIGINRAFESLSGYNATELAGQKPRMLKGDKNHPNWEAKMYRALESNGNWHGEVKCELPDKSNLTLWMEVNAIQSRSNHPKCFVASFVDITERIKREEELESLTTKDPLTGINNRRQFDHTMNQLEKAARRYPRASFCLALFDLDYFKQVNDIYGHTTGDRILQSFSKLVLSQLREQDLFARLGGDEFALIMPFTSLEEANLVCHRLRSSTQQLTLDPKITVSIGVACYCVIETHQDLYDRADKALYQAKALGRNRVVSEEKIMASSRLPDTEFSHS